MTVQVEEKTADDPSGPSPTGGGVSVAGCVAWVLSAKAGLSAGSAAG
eukprot:COSAG05_NODE_20_length_33177_cov_336.302639_10_plen_47_part_00